MSAALTRKSLKTNGKHPAPAAMQMTREEVLEDFRTCCLSREASVIARKEVLSGKANFGIIGDGKEVAQVAMARAWKKGDFRAGYYRDQTLMFALGLLSLEEFFAQLYGDPVNDTVSLGRQMNCHFATPFVDDQGNFLDLKNRYNISSDISCTAGQMARGLGLAMASRKFRELPQLCADLSENGNEICWVTIGDASTSEGPFWESLNAAGVMQVPMSISVWDDGYGISVPKKYQTSKESISEILKGFDGDGGVNIRTARAWNYAELRQVYAEGAVEIRTTHRPYLFHIQEVTQQLGHSTSGDHRRYKSPERLAFEEAYDCNKRMAEWIIAEGFATADEVAAIQTEAKKTANQAAQTAYRALHESIKAELSEARQVIQDVANAHTTVRGLSVIAQEINQLRDPLRHEIIRLARRAHLMTAKSAHPSVARLKQWIDDYTRQGAQFYSENLHSQSPKSALKVKAVPAVYSAASPNKDAFEILNACFDANFAKMPNLFAFGEDVGQIGDVNQGMRGMQAKYGEERVFDTGIREWTIMGQAIGMSMRGLRPIAEIQYLDYIYYGLAPLADDLTTLRWRTNGQQVAPAIIRTRGHRLVGVWHAGSPIGMMLGSLRGMWFCVPRNMTQAAGMYNTLLHGDDPAIVIECLNGYRFKEKQPDNIGEFTVPLGHPEVLREGSDITLITYGSCVRVAEEAATLLADYQISVEVIDVQTLLPFDLTQTCVASLKKTNRVIFLDEDVPGGGTGYLMQQVLELQGGYQYIDSKPVTISSKEHRPAYGQDGDYFSKPQVEDIMDAAIRMMQEFDPGKY